MKAIKNGKIYDTEQAERICKYSNMKDKRNFRHFKEELYKTEKGRYFLFGRGGPKTQYSEHNGGTVSGGQEITTLTKDEALEWAEKKGFINGEVEDVIKEFSEELEQA